MNAHFFDIDTLININSNIWIISKIEPNVPIIKITQSEFNLIKKGIYRKYNSPLEINGTKYWIPENLLNDLKIKCKNMRYNITDLSFSMQEFMNQKIIENLDYQILKTNFQHLKNTNDDIYVICSKNSKRNYSSMIKKLEKELLEIGLKVKDYYFLSETFYNRDTDHILNIKCKLILQHLIGLKTKEEQFTDTEITKYDNISYYDDDLKSVENINNSNNTLQFLISNSEENTKSKIKEIIKSKDNKIITYQVTNNKINPFIKKEILIECSNLVKTFEGFVSNLFKKDKKNLIKYNDFDIEDLRYLFIDLEDLNFDVSISKKKVNNILDKPQQIILPLLAFQMFGKNSPMSNIKSDVYVIVINEGDKLKNSDDVKFIKNKNEIIRTINFAISYTKYEYGLDIFKISQTYCIKLQDSPTYRKTTEINNISEIDYSIPNLTIELIKIQN